MHPDAFEELTAGCFAGHVSGFEHFNRMLQFVRHRPGTLPRRQIFTVVYWVQRSVSDDLRRLDATDI